MLNNARPQFAWNAPGFVMNSGQMADEGPEERTGAGAYKYRTLKITPAEIHLVQSALWAWGVTFQGAQQFATGSPVNNPADRQAISGMVGQLLKIVAVRHDQYK
ncbi:MAG TPA: hypothetical protein VGF55_01860 [Gemmataceae bacterium]|jgi:hypothetical protein